MDFKRTAEMVRGLTRDDGILCYNPAQVRLLLQVLRALARGRPVTGPEVDAIAEDLGWAPNAAQIFLRPLTERDAADAIIGVFPGLSLAEHPHTLSVNGQRMSAWCAEDTLFLPALLGQTATIESTSPLSRAPVRLTVGPEGIQSVSPPEAVISIAIVDPDDTAADSVQAIWTTFCQHIHFFASRKEAERWAAGRADIAILTPDEGYQVGRQLTTRFLDQAG
ncbi:MAG TPA: organomercurial lyase [Methylomirabilota bacterium]|nr:organomercurial lyase [Methylomirabilota bacterium]